MEQQKLPLLKLLAEKKKLFEHYEALTDRLAEEEDLAAMEDYITKRGELANKIDEQDKKIKESAEDYGRAAAAALSASSRQEELPEELLPAFELNQQILTLVRRIRLKDTQITREYEHAREESLAKIKASSNLPKINRYLNGLSSPEDANNFGRV